MGAAEEWFKNAPEKEDAVLWTAMVSGYMDAANVQKAMEFFSGNAGEEWYVKSSCPGDALRVFKTMVADAVFLKDVSTLSSVLLGCSNLSALGFGKQIHQ